MIVKFTYNGDEKADAIAAGSPVELATWIAAFSGEIPSLTYRIVPGNETELSWFCRPRRIVCKFCSTPISPMRLLFTSYDHCPATRCVSNWKASHTG